MVDQTARGVEVFRRRREVDDLDDQDFDEYDEEVVATPAPQRQADPDEIENQVNPTAAPVARPEVAATTGPWDSHDKPRDDDLARVDLGGLRVPIPDGVELRVEVQEDTVVAAALVQGNSQLIVHAFAAPKSSGIWTEVRNEIADSLRQGGGAAEDTAGPFGTELKARIPGEDGISQPARFLGIDGPRWFLRGLMTGPAATDPTQATKLEEVFRRLVVHRGGDAMAPRDALPLHLPREVIEQAVPADDEPPAPTLQLQERGPEITEIQ
jgi:hypothetical protein